MKTLFATRLGWASLSRLPLAVSLSVLLLSMPACSKKEPEPTAPEPIAETEADETHVESPAKPPEPPKEKKPLAEVIAGSWTAVNVDDLSSKAESITWHFTDAKRCQLVVRFANSESVEEGAYEVNGEELKLDLDRKELNEGLTTSYDGFQLKVTDKDDTVIFERMP